MCAVAVGDIAVAVAAVAAVVAVCGADAVDDGVPFSFQHEDSH